MSYPPGVTGKEDYFYPADGPEECEECEADLSGQDPEADGSYLCPNPECGAIWYPPEPGEERERPDPY